MEIRSYTELGAPLKLEMERIIEGYAVVFGQESHVFVRQGKTTRFC